MNIKIKKRYSSPHIESIAIDQEITLVMASDVPCAPGDCAPPASIKKTKTIKKSTPFGGTRPEYTN
jgi:hypothetical protein